ncbi:MAG: Holliday junction branch migration DNA helicase RuvB [Candidatus Delongbacteria bacterium]|nr:Holliday junction branch migration DNA helicase RuvB [Candidatus Delongbacteria bacterium]MDD4205088.1 Holliday junction branch migration DNA helicase RuvB [Candidatus Delongbacteria bacterium]MDY0016952.1 Holliday junction branch migration DNA helicase RuvB [Candidatus Delongbacteria bacterium]
MRETILTGSELGEDKEIERSLRPLKFQDFVGQEKIKDNLKIFVESAKIRNDSLDHTILHGPPGLGKTTLAHLIANELGVDIKVTSGPVLEKAADLAGLLTNLKDRDVIFIDEIHRLSPVIEEYLYPAMEDYTIDIMLSSGPSANSVQLQLPKFTLIGATTKAGNLTSPLRARFGVSCRMSYYNSHEIYKIIQRSSSILDIPIDDPAAEEISKRSRGTPRIAIRLLRRIRDFALVKHSSMITKNIACEALLSLEIDEKGLDEMDRAIILSMIDKFDGGPVGIKNIAVVVGEESDTLEEVYEPFLIQEGFIQRTQRGRIVTELGYRHFSRKYVKNELGLI